MQGGLHRGEPVNKAVLNPHSTTYYPSILIVPEPQTQPCKLTLTTFVVQLTLESLQKSLAVCLVPCLCCVVIQLSFYYVCMRVSMLQLQHGSQCRTEPEGCSPKGEGYISCTARDWHALCIIYPKGGVACRQQHFKMTNSTGAFICSPGQCYNKNTVSPSRYCMRFIIFAKLSNSLTTGYMCLCVLYVGHNLAGQSHGSRNRLLCNTRNFSASLYKNTANLHLQLSLPIATLITAKKGF